MKKKSAWFWRGEQWSGQFDSHFYNSHSESAPKHRTWKRLMSLLKQTSGVVNIARHDQQCTTSRYELLLWNKFKKRLECLNWACVTIKDNIRNYTTWNSQIVEYTLKATKEHFQKILFKRWTDTSKSCTLFPCPVTPGWRRIRKIPFTRILGTVQSSTPFATSQKPTLKPRELALEAIWSFGMILDPFRICFFLVLESWEEVVPFQKTCNFPIILQNWLRASLLVPKSHGFLVESRDVSGLLPSHKRAVQRGEEELHREYPPHRHDGSPGKIYLFWWGTCGTVEPSTLYSHHQPLVGWVCFHRVQPLVGWVCFEEQGGPALLTFNHGFNRWKNSTLTVGWNPSC